MDSGECRIKYRLKGMSHSCNHNSTFSILHFPFYSLHSPFYIIRTLD